MGQEEDNRVSIARLDERMAALERAQKSTCEDIGAINETIKRVEMTLNTFVGKFTGGRVVFVWLSAASASFAGGAWAIYKYMFPHH